jgi:hypothetical protein
LARGDHVAGDSYGVAAAVRIIGAWNRNASRPTHVVWCARFAHGAHVASVAVADAAGNEVPADGNRIVVAVGLSASGGDAFRAVLHIAGGTLGAVHTNVARLAGALATRCEGTRNRNGVLAAVGEQIARGSSTVRVAFVVFGARVTQLTGVACSAGAHAAVDDVADHRGCVSRTIGLACTGCG